MPPHSDPEEPIFIVCGRDGESMRCRICGAVDEVAYDEVPSMAGYGEDTYTRCVRCGSVETTASPRAGAAVAASAAVGAYQPRCRRSRGQAPQGVTRHTAS
jgi:uncharacterized C2H2 Zn-finger protein